MNEIVLETSAFGISLFCLWECLNNRKDLYLQKKTGKLDKLKDQHFVYLMLMFCLIISSFFSVLDAAMENYLTFQSIFLLDFFNEMYFIFHTVLSFLFILYIVNMTGAFQEKSRRFYIIFSLPIILAEGMIFANPFTHLVYYVDENCIYHRSSCMWVIYAICFFYVLIGLVYFVKNMGAIQKMDRTAVLILVTIGIVGIIIQGLYTIKVEQFFESIGLFGFMLLLETSRSSGIPGRQKKLSRRFIIVIALIFLSVIAMNINLVYYAGMDQAGKLGEIQINNLKGEMQETISNSESTLLRYAMGLEQLVNDGEDVSRIRNYIYGQNAYYMDLSDGVCFSVYAASDDWTIIPDFDIPEEYHAKERVWYIGAKNHPGEVFISEPYIDASTGVLCYTFSTLLSDGTTVAAMDYTLEKVQDIVMRMADKKDQFSMIVTDSGTIIGCSMEGYQGEELKQVMPVYQNVFERVRASSEHKSFRANIDGRARIVFGSDTNNGWRLVLVVDYKSFYKETLEQMILIGAVDILMVVVIIVFYLVSVINQEKAENTLENTETLIESLSEDLTDPLNEIMRISGTYSRQEGAAEAFTSIYSAGKKIKEKVDNLFTYSNIRKSGAAKEAAHRKEKKKRKTDSGRFMKNGILVILIATMFSGLILCIAMTVRWGNERISKEADGYSSDVSLWMEQKKSMLRMFTDVIAANPDILTDYDSAVRWLADVTKNYDEVTFAYLANPYNTEHPVIMNSGWEPGPDYRPEERQWYIDTERSGDGFSISAPYYDAQTGLYCITFSRSVYTPDGRFLGIFGIDCLLDNLIDVLDDSYTGESYAFMVDRNGIIINHPNKEYELSEESSVNVEDTEYADAFHNGRAFGMHDYNGRLVSCCTEKSTLSGFTVTVVQSWWGIYGSLILVSIFFMGMLAASIVGVVRMINRFTGWQQETNERLQEAADTAVAAEKAKSRFLAQMSHEIRTPINAVLGMNEMILRESSDGSIREYAGNIRSAGKNLLGLINSILDFSKIEEGKMEIIPGRYDTSMMIENIINSVSQRAEGKGLVFIPHIDSTLPSTLYGDDMRVSQVVINLLTNAVKYTREGRVDLYMDGVRTDQDRISLKVRVKDTGIGIKEEDINRLFESFTRLEETKNRNIEGTGLGMAIVNGLLGMMGSSLKVESVYGQGSEFSFEVTQEIIDDSPIGDYEEKARQAMDKDEGGKYLYAPEAGLLVVDDIDMNLKVIANLLKLNGITPDLAHSGKEALEKLGKKHYDAVMLDHMMPEMDGIETLQKAREENLIPEGCVVIALTANAVSGARETYMKAGFDAYLSKPVEVKAMEKTLEKYLPKEKVSFKLREEEQGGTGDAAGGAAGRAAGNAAGTGGEALLDEREGIVISEGLRYCGNDKNFYHELLRDYLTSSEGRMQELDQALSDQDMKLYAIRVHALKSVSRSIGAVKLADYAARLEELAKAEKENEVRDGHPGLKEEVDRITSAISDMGLEPAEDGGADDIEIMEFAPEEDGES